MIYFLIILLTIAVLLEGTVTTIPLVFICLLCMAVMRREGIIFPAAFFSGLVLDIFTLQTWGASSMFFLLALFLVFLYQRKYEINSFPFLLVSSFFGSWIYLSLFHYNNGLFIAVFSTIVATIFFGIVRLIIPQEINSRSAPVVPAKAGIHFRK